MSEDVVKDGSATTDRQLLVALPMAFVIGIAVVLYQSVVPDTVPLTVCEKVVDSSSVRLLDGRILDVGESVYDRLDAPATYVTEHRWFQGPVFNGVADESSQEGDLC